MSDFKNSLGGDQGIIDLAGGESLEGSLQFGFGEATLQFLEYASSNHCYRPRVEWFAEVLKISKSTWFLLPFVPVAFICLKLP